MARHRNQQIKLKIKIEDLRGKPQIKKNHGREAEDITIPKCEEHNQLSTNLYCLLSLLFEIKSKIKADPDRMLRNFAF